MLEPIEMRGAEWWDILKLYSRFLQAERWVLSCLHMVGITGVGLEGRIVARITAIGADNLLEGIVGLLGLEPTENGNWRYKLVEVAYWYIFPAVQVLIAFFILDTWQYFWHRLMHESKWLYRELHFNYPVPAGSVSKSLFRNFPFATPPPLCAICIWRALQPPV